MAEPAVTYTEATPSRIRPDGVAGLVEKARKPLLSACGRKANAMPTSRLDEVAGPKRLEITLVFVSCGRPDVLGRTVSLAKAQTRQPDRIIVSATEHADVGPLLNDGSLDIVFGPKGACRQRNAALDALSPSTDLVIFFDDDFVAHPKWIERIERCFLDRPGVDCITGCLLADGVRQGGLTFSQSLDLINGYDGACEGYLEEGYSPYGCNMAYRFSRISGIRFDERLVLYGWLEDRDFGAALSKKGGRLIKTGSAVGVHLGVNRGRLPGLKLGYSQVVNPVYLYGKTHISFMQLLRHIGRNVAMNLMRSLHAERHVDRKGRLAGNLIGCVHLICGIVEPERAAHL